MTYTVVLKTQLCGTVRFGYSAILTQPQTTPNISQNTTAQHKPNFQGLRSGLTLLQATISE